MTLCYLGLGSNLRSPQRQLRQAVSLIRNIPQTAMIKQSPLYASRPYGVPSQPRYTNMVVALHTKLPPRQLLSYCQGIEHQQQRVRKKHWGARTIDIDILLYGHLILTTHSLTIPHPHMLKRDFVLQPLLAIAPKQRMPDGTLCSTHLHNCAPYVIAHR